MTYGLVSESTSARDLQDGQLDPQIFTKHCFEWSVSALKVRVCLDPSGESGDVYVYLLGTEIGHGRIDRNQACTNLGGSVDGFKAVVKVCFVFEKPRKITVDAELCTLVKCWKYHHEFPVPLAEEVGGETGG